MGCIAYLCFLPSDAFGRQQLNGCKSPVPPILTTLAQRGRTILELSAIRSHRAVRYLIGSYTAAHSEPDLWQANQAGQTKSDDAPKETAAEEATVDDESPPEATRRVTRSKTAANQKDGAQVGNESPAANSARKRKHRASPSAASAARSKRGRKAPSP